MKWIKICFEEIKVILERVKVEQESAKKWVWQRILPKKIDMKSFIIGFFSKNLCDIFETNDKHSLGIG